MAGSLADDEDTVERICDLLGNLPLAVRLVGRYLREQNKGLVDYGLLEQEEGQYALSHALVNTYARRRLEPPEGTVERLAQLFGELWEKRAEDDAGARRLMAELRPHVMAVLAALEESGNWQAVLVLADAVRDYLDVLCFATDRVAVCEAALRAVRETEDTQGEGAWLGNLGTAYSDLGQVEEAIGYYEEALAISRETADRRGEGYWLVNLGAAYEQLDEIEKARAYWEQTLAIFEEIQSPEAETVWDLLAGLEGGGE